ncbi:hypothetical protein ACD578_17070 [Microvirga sp. RSM25]|uniref:hypothetical protein n=1 Tax=Microvirga sp. RSM25 TaxID=3273802 RepID=UPI00384C7079
MVSVKLVAAVSGAFLLAACTTTTPADRRRADEAQCRSYGFRPGTNAFSHCLLDLDLNRAADRRARLDDPYRYGPPGWYWRRGW